MSDLISREDAIRWVKTECNPYGKPTLDFESGKKIIEHLKQMPSAHVKEKEYPCEHCKFATYMIVEERYWCSKYRMYDRGAEINFGFPCELFRKVCNKGENYEE